MATPACLPRAIPSVGIIVSVTALAVQIHRARFNQSIDLLFKVEGDFGRPAKKLQRVKAAEELLAGRSLEAEPILDFLETMALSMRRGALDEELVKHTFYDWIDFYYAACESAIVERQRLSPLVWKDLSELVVSLRSIQLNNLD